MLVFTALICSGLLGLLGFRDFATTGKNVLGRLDETYLLYTQSTDWYDDSAGWKSTQGGFSAIASVSTDANNMGGFFVRKAAGAVTLGWHLVKVWPLLYQTTAASWRQGHYTPWLWLSAFGNVSLAVFYGWFGFEWHQQQSEESHDLVRFALVHVTVLLLEAVVFLYFARTCRQAKPAAAAAAFQDGQTPSSLPSKIVTRTVMLVSGAMAVMAARDLWATGSILEFWPRDDVYLEWTNALRHSPPVGSPEYAAHGWETPLYAGEKFIAQVFAVHWWVLCVVKLVAACAIRVGADGHRGTIQTKLIWQGTALANVALLAVVRAFTPAAATASLDLRYHLMALGYETFILGLYGFF